MNSKRAKILRRQKRAFEMTELAFQESLRQQIPVPVQTMSLADFNKARSQVGGGIGVIATTPRTPDDLELMYPTQIKALDTQVSENGTVFKASDAHGARGVICEVWPDDRMPVAQETAQ